MLFRLYSHWRNAYSGIPTTIWFLALVSLVNRCGAMVIAFITIYLTQHIGFNIREAGYVMGFFGVGALAGAYAGGRLTDRFGYYHVQLWSLILNGFMLFLLLLVRSFWAISATVFLLSFVAELFRPANSVAMANNSDPETRTRSISLMRMAFNIGWTIAPALGGLLASLGWHWLFWVDGLTCLLAALMLRWLTAPKAVLKPVVPLDELEPEAVKAEARVSIPPYRDRPYMIFLLLTLLNAVVFMQILWTVPVFFKEGYHWSEAKIGLIAAVNGLVVFLVEMPLIFSIEGKRSRLHFVRLGLMLYALAYLGFLAPSSDGLGPALFFMIAISFGEIFVMPFSSNYVFGRSLQKGNQGLYLAFYTMSYSLSNILAPLFGTQVIAAWGYQTLWILLGILSAVAWMGFWLLEKRTEPEA